MLNAGGSASQRKQHEVQWCLGEHEQGIPVISVHFLYHKRGFSFEVRWKQICVPNSGTLRTLMDPSQPDFPLKLLALIAEVTVFRNVRTFVGFIRLRVNL